MLHLTIQLPEKLGGLYEPRRYKVMHGAVVVANSMAWPRCCWTWLPAIHCEFCVRARFRSPCATSVHRLLKDNVVKLGLQGFFEVLDNEIRGKSDSLILFSGLQSHTIHRAGSKSGWPRP